MRTTLAIVTGLALLVDASPARATPDVRAALETELNLGYSPGCTLCHDGTPGPGTATTPFATSMIQRGLTPADTTSVAGAVAAMRADQVDSDGDGQTDIDELIAGQDPNVAGGSLATDSPEYGCGASIADRVYDPLGACAALVVSLTLLRLGRRRRDGRVTS